VVTVTLYSNSILDCGQGVLINPLSFYTFNLVSNGQVTSLGSYKVPSGSSTLDTLTPINSVPIVNTPTGDSTYLRLDLGNWGNLVQPVPSLSSTGRINSNTGYQLNSAAPNNHVLCGNGTNYVDATTCGVNTGVTSFNTRTGGVTLTSGDVTTALGFTPPSITGTGATGTWNISITGNAATATTATTATALAGTPTQCSSGYATGIAANGNANCAGSSSIIESFNVAGCSAPASTDSQCNGTITLATAMPDTNYTPTLTVNATGFLPVGGGGPGPYLSIQVAGALTTTTIPYNISCTFGCGISTAATIYVLAKHN
jgi:hypothetical protein